jgi:protein LTV1
MILKQYNNEDALSSDEESASDEAPELITSREDFDSMMDEFLNDYEQLGRKLKPKLPGETGTEKLDTIRRALGQDERVLIGEEEEEDSDDIYAPFEDDDKKDRWDCETILSEYPSIFLRLSFNLSQQQRTQI